MTGWEGIHTCHDQCPCHAGGEPVPDFVPGSGRGLHRMEIGRSHNEREAVQALRDEWDNDHTVAPGTYSRWLEHKVVTLAQQHAGAVEVVRAAKTYFREFDHLIGEQDYPERKALRDALVAFTADRLGGQSDDLAPAPRERHG